MRGLGRQSAEGQGGDEIHRQEHRRPSRHAGLARRLRLRRTLRPPQNVPQGVLQHIRRGAQKVCEEQVARHEEGPHAAAEVPPE